MAGEWKVAQQMWPGPGQEAQSLPPAVAHRRLIGKTILEESMELAPGAKGQPFTRMSYFDYNTVGRQYEYFSIDSRAPQMMNERGSFSKSHDQRGNEPLSLWGDIFVAPQWGNTANAAFRYRIVIGPINENGQSIRLYLTPVSAQPGDEFLAFEYLYTRPQ
ncbi:MAG: DUF1579 family protein [Acidobacteria bacterium]|nr:DUF1579 family protein [Acidobacteriota bacterium]